jgi:hypothetical protein
MSDSTVLAATKATNGSTYAYQTESAAVRLCAGATSATSPISCFKDAMSDSTVLAATKTVNGNTYAYQTESAAVKLCETLDIH